MYFSYVMNVQIDDGSGNLRAVFFRNQAKVFMGKEEEDILKFRDDPTLFEPMKEELLGNFVKLIGRVNKNTMFDRLEFVTQMVITNPDPKKELENV